MHRARKGSRYETSIIRRDTSPSICNNTHSTDNQESSAEPVVTRDFVVLVFEILVFDHLWPMGLTLRFQPPLEVLDNTFSIQFLQKFKLIMASFKTPITNHIARLFSGKIPLANKDTFIK